MIWTKENGERINLHHCPLCDVFTTIRNKFSGERVEKAGPVKKEREAPE